MRRIDQDEYWIFDGMKQRCGNPNHHAYKYYGGRGIVVEWQSYDDFINDMGHRPTKKHSIDRINPDKNYTKNNCRWVTMSYQALNRRQKSTNTSGYTGVSFYKPTGRWLARISLNGNRKSLGYFATKEEAAERYKIERDRLLRNDVIE